MIHSSGTRGIINVAVLCSLQVSVFAQGSSVPELARDAITVAVDLASDVAPEDEVRRKAALDALAEELEMVELTSREALLGLDVEPDLGCASLAAARGPTPSAYLVAMRASYACFLGAQQMGDIKATAEHLTAVGLYAERARAALLDLNALTETTIRTIETEPFAQRRGREEAAALVARIEREGLGPGHVELLRASGLSQEAIETYRKDLLATPLEELGISIVEFYRDILEFRRAAAEALVELTDGGAAASALPRSASFVVGNPKDRDATMELILRRVSIPPTWELLIEEEPGPADPTAAGKLSQIGAGERYEVRLGPKEEIRVTSVVLPVGPVERGTVARWAVEGRIGDEIIGGMMHELYVPAIVPNLVLPPIAPAAATQPSQGVRERVPSLLIGGIATIALIIIVAAVLVVRRRRTSPAQSHGTSRSR